MPGGMFRFPARLAWLATLLLLLFAVNLRVLVQGLYLDGGLLVPLLGRYANLLTRFEVVELAGLAIAHHLGVVRKLVRVFRRFLADLGLGLHDQFAAGDADHR